MKMHGKAMITFIILSLAVFAGAQAATITVTGTVQDSVTGQPIAGALILLHDTKNLGLNLSDFSSLALDTTVSGTDGKFSYVKPITTGSLVLVYSAIKDGHQIIINYKFIVGTTIDLGTIKLAPNKYDTLTVIGKVVDSISNQPLGQALVVMSDLSGRDTAGNTVITGADGTFSKQVVVGIIIAAGTKASVVAYAVSRTNYAIKAGQKQASGKQLDLGTIALKPTTSAIYAGSRIYFVKNQPDAMAVYSLTGRQLYSGPMVASLAKIAVNKSVTAIIIFKKNNAIIGSRQVFLAR